MKIALVHDFLTQYGGAERVLDAFLEIWPQAPVFTLVYDRERLGHRYDKYDIRPSFIQRLPFGVKKYKWYLALMPKAIEFFDLSGYDVVLSDSSAFAKGVQTRKPTTHICYLHTPTRYLWSDRDSYLKTAPIPFLVRPLMPLVIKYLQDWDLQAANRPDFYIANSANISQRMQRYYHRRAKAIIWPPVEAKKFTIFSDVGDYFLLVGRMEPYKKIELVIAAFKELGPAYKLKIIGTGSKKEELERFSAKNIQFIGRVSDKDLAGYYSRAKALIFPQEEDAGITALESMAAGRPVIAYGAGGVLEIVKEGITGEFFDKQSESSIMKAVKSFQAEKYQPRQIRQFAWQFDKEVFKKKIENFIKKVQR